jgi:CheY-like chemotaxis protein
MSEPKNSKTRRALGRSSVPWVFLADDSDDDAFFFERALTKTQMPFSFSRVENGQLAIDALGAAQAGDGLAPGWPDLVFLDLKMPIQSGFDVLEWVQSEGLTPAPTVIVLSGSNDHADRRRAAALGASDYLVKPISMENLKSLLEALRDAENDSMAGRATEL